MSQISKQALIVDNNQSFPTNNAGEITPSDLRAFNVNMIDSLVNEIPYQSFTASVTNSINLLNAFTSSQQPSFTNLNAFTASQLTINTGYNAATSSLNNSVSVLQSQTAQLSTFTGSINQIQSAGILQGYATRFNFSGLFTASIVANVNGNIADISLVNDNTKVSTSSFNAYTASTNSSISNLNQYTASQNVINAATTASLQQLLNLSSSLSGGYATQGELDASSSALQNNIDTKLNTSSFNAYTQSTNIVISGLATTSSFNAFTSSQGASNTIINQFTASTNLFTASINTYTASNDTKWTTIGLLTGSYATTGSNTFIGNQTITGSTTITGSVLGNISTLTISSNTASMDLSKGNFFTLTLVSGSTTELTATNITPGQTINLLITQANPASGSLSYNSTFKFPAGNNYIATAASSSKDIITFITFDNSTIYAAAINNLL